MKWSAGLDVDKLAGKRVNPFAKTVVDMDELADEIHALPDPGPGATQVLGVDDFAPRRGHSYGTLLADIATRRPVDVLPERSADSSCAWLDARPGIQAIRRDRADCYTDGAARGAHARANSGRRTRTQGTPTAANCPVFAQ